MAPATGSISLRAWAWLVLGAALALCVIVATMNAIVDPTAQLGTGVLDPIAAGPRDREAKVELLEEVGVPSLVVLGSSRTKKLDPADLGATQGVNAAVVGGDSFEQRVLAAWLARRATPRDAAYPQLVVGVDVEQFRDSSLQGSGFLDVPQLEAVARAEAAGSDGSVGDELDRLERLLLTWQVTKASAASLRQRMRPRSAAGAGSDAARDGRQNRATFTATGVPGADARWFDEAAARRFARRTPGLVETNIAELRATYETTGSTLDPDAVEDLRALVRIVREAGGPPPLLYVTPAHPKLIEALAAEGRDTRQARVVDLLASLAEDGAARVVDCSTCVDGDDLNWIDATHPSPLGARQLAERLRRELERP